MESPGTPVYSVTQITEEISSLLSEEFYSIGVEGEISGWKVAASGHAYFSLKDENALIKAVMWRSRLNRLDHEPEDGQLVRAYGSLTVYPPRGDYQIDVLRITQAGVGLLQKRFEELKKKLETEGLFDPERKKPPPRRVRRVVVITSPTGAAIRDFLRVIETEAVPVEILILPVRVQGFEAPPEIVAALAKAAEMVCDLIVLTRGGGSLEDLWAFNEEIVARAIAASKVPVLSAVGHEIDTTIADFVADIRVPTPTAAAQWIVDLDRAVSEPFRELLDRLVSAMKDVLAFHGNELESLQHRLYIQSPLSRLAYHRQFVDDLVGRAERALDNRLGSLKSRVESHRHHLLSHFRMFLSKCDTRYRVLNERFQAHEPRAVLKRGFARCETAEGQRPVRCLADVLPGNDLRVHLVDGSFLAEVINEETTPP